MTGGPPSTKPSVPGTGAPAAKSAVSAARAGDLILTGGASGDLGAQIAALVAAVERQGAQAADICLLRVFYRADQHGAESLARDIERLLAGRAAPALTLIPVARAGSGEDAVSIEAVAVGGPADRTRRVVPALPGQTGTVAGIRNGRFLFLAGHRADAATGLVEESHKVMAGLGATLGALGAGFGDVVRMNRWYHAAGTKDDWEPSARAVAAFYDEPGPVATAISLPVPLDGGFAIQIELMGMIGEDGAALPKTHSWPQGHWDWPIHLPYKHGLACGGLAFVGGQVSLDGAAKVIDPDDIDRQITRSLANIEAVLGGFGAPQHRLLHLDVYHEVPAPDAAYPEGLSRLAHGPCPAALIGFPYLSYPDMRVEIEAIAALDGGVAAEA